MVALEARQQAELGRLLAAAAGYLVRSGEAKNLGHVDHVRYREHTDRPDQIAVRRRWFWQCLLLVSFETVAAVDPRARTVTLRSASSRWNGSRNWSHVSTRETSSPTRIGGEMFKRGKSAAAGARRGKLASLAAALAGAIGGLIFWRKRKAS